MLDLSSTTQSYEEIVAKENTETALELVIAGLNNLEILKENIESQV